MEGVYAALRRAFKAGLISFKSAATVNLDEYLGLDPSHEQSYCSYMNRHLFDHVDIDKSKTCIPSGVDSPDGILSKFQSVLDRASRDFQLLGVGANGHIGFNEPAPFFLSQAHIVDLDAKTREDNARFFSSLEEVPSQAVTMGIGDILNATKIVLLATGDSKVTAMRELFLHDCVSPECPCTALKLHADATVILTRDLAQKAGIEKSV